MKFKESKKVELKKSTAQLKQALENTGIQTMNDAIKAAGLPAPVYEEIGSSFVVTFKRRKTTQETTQEGSEKVRRRCGESAELVFAAIKENKFIKTHEMVEKTGLSQRTVENAIAKLKKAKFLKREGSPKSGHWEVLHGKRGHI